MTHITSLLFALVALVAGTAAEAGGRVLTVDDTFRLEGAGTYYGGPVSFAPDGKTVAFTRTRSLATSRDFRIDYLWNNDLGDVWLKRPGASEPTNITQGAADGSGWWSPAWSPDGRYVAMLSTRGPSVGDNIWLWIWDSHTGALRRLSERGVDSDANTRRHPYMWLDERHLLCPLLPEGGRPIGLDVERKTQRIATQQWPRTVLGEQVSANVLDSGVPVDFSKRPQGQLMRVDVATGESTLIAAASSVGHITSPRGDYIAYARQIGVTTPRADAPVAQELNKMFTLDVLDRAGRRVLTAESTARDVEFDSLRWSPRGDRIALFGFEQVRDGVQQLYVGDPRRGTLDVIDLGSLYTGTIGAWWIPPQIEWTADGALLIRGIERVNERRPAGDARRDWWLVTLDGKRRNLTRTMQQVPAQLWPEPSRQSFVGLVDGELWRIRPNAPPSRLLPSFGEKIEQIAWPTNTNDGQREFALPGTAYADLVLGIRRGGELALEHLQLASGKRTALAVPTPGAELLSFSPSSGQSVFQAHDAGGGLRLLLSARDGATSTLIEANGWLRDITRPEQRSFEYTSLDGEKLRGWLLLPVGYTPGHRYPLITSVYAGAVFSEVPPGSLRFGQSLNPYSPQIWAARGYAVLMPSMPLNPWGNPDDPMLRLPNGVLPAVDKVVELGIADPRRLFVMGASFGGFSTYGLVTQTKRFAAGVSLAGLSDLISLYGQFDARMRYSDYPQDHLGSMQKAESGQTGMGAPPWADLNRYLRNSPLFSVDRVQTPLMIVQGDMDYVALQQGEEFFNALYRQGKRARFVRYWGEGHAIRSPANARDLVDRIDAWFQEIAPPNSGS
ncbi:MAG TPA: prolyl oligopeptidase family serine peptidase [Steroidobacter sp.]